MNATGNHYHKSGSLTFSVCVSETWEEGGCFEGEQVVIWCSKTEGESGKSLSKREKKEERKEKEGKGRKSRVPLALPELYQYDKDQ